MQGLLKINRFHVYSSYHMKSKAIGAGSAAEGIATNLEALTMLESAEPGVKRDDPSPASVRPGGRGPAGPESWGTKVQVS